MITSCNNESITAIVVDDDIDTLDVFCEYLQLYQFRIVGKAYNGEKVAELYSKFKPDVVFLDVMMNNFDGIYALAEIRKINPDAVVIMVTADLTQETDEKLRQLHATSIIYKPFDINNVMRIVKSLVTLPENTTHNLKQSELTAPITIPVFHSQPKLEIKK